MKRMFGILALMVVASIMIAGCVQPEGNDTVTPIPTTPAATETPLETVTTPAEVETTAVIGGTATTPIETETTTVIEGTATTPIETETPPPPSLGAEAILITEDGFSPETLTIPADTTVTWTNDAIIDQIVTITGPSGVIELGTIEPGGSADYTFTETGEYTYVSAETGLEGTVTVTGSTTP